jgi:predicted ATPase
MVATLLGSHTLPPGLLQFIQEKAGGNPLFIEEVTQALIERGLVVRADGGFTWTSAAEVAFPDTIQDIMRARIDRLQEPVKRTVQTAAVIGREFGLRLLTRISERAAEIQHDLGTLKQAELIHETHLFPELAYRFKHAVIQDVAYESLLVQRRQALHGAIGQAIEVSTLTTWRSRPRFSPTIMPAAYTKTGLWRMHCSPGIGPLASTPAPRP